MDRESNKPIIKYDKYLHAASAKRGKMFANNLGLVFLLSLIGWECGARFLSQSQTDDNIIDFINKLFFIANQKCLHWKENRSFQDSHL